MSEEEPPGGDRRVRGPGTAHRGASAWLRVEERGAEHMPLGALPSVRKLLCYEMEYAE